MTHRQSLNTHTDEALTLIEDEDLQGFSHFIEKVMSSEENRLKLDEFALLMRIVRHDRSLFLKEIKMRQYFSIT